jgi:hypothetical protein
MRCELELMILRLEHIYIDDRRCCGANAPSDCDAHLDRSWLNLLSPSIPRSHNSVAGAEAQLGALS